MSIGKLQRNHLTGRIKRNSSSGKIKRNSANASGTCSNCGCSVNCDAPFNCTTCTDGTPNKLYISYSGVVLSTSCLTGCANQVQSNVGGTLSGSGCMSNGQSSFNPCFWNFSSGPSGLPNGYTVTTYTCGCGIVSCSAVVTPTQGVNFTLLVSGTTWTLTGWIASSGTALQVFRGTTTASPVLCYGASFTITNTVAINTCYTTLVPNGYTQAIGGASGGSATITFNSSCCS